MVAAYNSSPKCLGLPRGNQVLLRHLFARNTLILCHNPNLCHSLRRIHPIWLMDLCSQCSAQACSNSPNLLFLSRSIQVHVYSHLAENMPTLACTRSLCHSPQNMLPAHPLSQPRQRRPMVAGWANLGRNNSHSPLYRSHHNQERGYIHASENTSGLPHRQHQSHNRPCRASTVLSDPCPHQQALEAELVLVTAQELVQLSVRFPVFRHSHACHQNFHKIFRSNVLFVHCHSCFACTCMAKSKDIVFALLRDPLCSSNCSYHSHISVQMGIRDNLLPLSSWSMGTCFSFCFRHRQQPLPPSSFEFVPVAFSHAWPHTLLLGHP
mmetsp:Transcript_33679/g.66238  ORF Transcript_33679/g.66238 Transcript_33679/m.66238 type:complete len:323 (-) Transcript_33679:130-1098(-)